MLYTAIISHILADKDNDNDRESLNKKKEKNFFQRLSTVIFRSSIKSNSARLTGGLVKG